MLGLQGRRAVRRDAPRLSPGTQAAAARGMPNTVLDPGHGGGRTAGGSSALGVRGPAGTLEKDVTLAVARHVAASLGGDVALTRSGDENPTIAARARTARDGNARVFLSLHANSGPSDARGSEVWIHPRSGATSARLAEQLRVAMRGLGAVDRGIKAADMGVLRPEHLAPGAAACLLELDFLSHPDGEQRLRDPASLARLGRAIAAGVRAFLDSGRDTMPARLARPLQAIDWCQIKQGIASTATSEEQVWTRNNGTKFVESDGAMLPRLQAYWRDGAGVGNWKAQANLSATDANGGAWSAAFVSWVLRTAGVPDGTFAFSSAHIDYIVAALRNRERSDRDKPFWLYGVDEQDQAQPQPGDILCFNRDASNFSYTSLRNLYWDNTNAVASAPMHCNIMTGTSQRGGRRFIQSIGGNRGIPGGAPNAGVTVALTDEIEVDESGVLQNPPAHYLGFIALVGCV